LPFKHPIQNQDRNQDKSLKKPKELLGTRRWPMADAKKCFWNIPFGLPVRQGQNERVYKLGSMAGILRIEACEKLRGKG
jgi:hypothetical protein